MSRIPSANRIIIEVVIHHCFLDECTHDTTIQTKLPETSLKEHHVPRGIISSVLFVCLCVFVLVFLGGARGFKVEMDYRSEFEGSIL